MFKESLNSVLQPQSMANYGLPQQFQITLARDERTCDEQESFLGRAAPKLPPNRDRSERTEDSGASHPRRVRTQSLRREQTIPLNRAKGPRPVGCHTRVLRIFGSWVHPVER